MIWKQEREPETKHGESEHGVTLSQRYASKVEQADGIDRQAGTDYEVGNPHPMPLESTSIRKAVGRKVVSRKLCMVTRSYLTYCDDTKLLPIPVCKQGKGDVYTTHGPLSNTHYLPLFLSSLSYHSYSFTHRIVYYITYWYTSHTSSSA